MDKTTMIQELDNIIDELVDLQTILKKERLTELTAMPEPEYTAISATYNPMLNIFRINGSEKDIPIKHVQNMLRMHHIPEDAKIIYTESFTPNK